MVSQGLLEQDESKQGKKIRRAYKITQVGLEFFKSFNNLEGL
jgi:hypothetical protein